MNQNLCLVLILFSLTNATLYSVNEKFQVSFEKSYNELAHATYEQRIYERGWNYLHVYANSQRTLLDQHRGAGFIQGYTTYRQIYAAYKNLCGGLLHGENLNNKAQDFVDNQLDYIDMMIQSHPFDLYWQYAQAYMEQLRYMYRGFLTRINIQNRLDYYIGFSQFYYLTNMGDLQDLIPAFSDSKMDHSHENAEGNCNGYAKLMNGQIYFAHSTHNIYEFLLRVFKTYHFPSRDERVGSDWITFSSRPGDLISKDDFYVLSSGLKVMETSFNNYNRSNYDSLSPLTVPCWLRTTIAVNLARTGQEFVNYFVKERSGTHNNQWVIIDPAKLLSGKNIVTFIQEGFSIYEVVDMTQRFLSQGYISSYNMPVSQNIYNILNYQKQPYNYDDDPRGIIYARYDKLISNVQDMKKWLIMNEEEDVRVGLAPRYDLTEKGAYAFGLTDCKVISPETSQDNFLWAISGPTQSGGRFPPFSWENWPNVPHSGMPIKWDFDWVKFPIDNEKSTEEPILEQA